MKRSDCINGPRPCRLRECQWHTSNLLRRSTPRRSCVLDIIDENPDGLSAGEIGDLFGVSKQAIQQAEWSGLEKLRDIWPANWGPTDVAEVIYPDWGRST